MVIIMAIISHWLDMSYWSDSVVCHVTAAAILLLRDALLALSIQPVVIFNIDSLVGIFLN